MRVQASACALALCLSLAPISSLHAADPRPTAPAPAPTPASTPAPTPAYTSAPAPASTPAPTPAYTSAPAPASKPSVAVDELVKSRSLITAKNYSQALVELKRVDRVMANNADVKNLLGFTSRKLGQYSQAGAYYVKALQIDPRHLGALEYQGELYIIQKKMALAKRNVAALKGLCGTSCEEYIDLRDAIAIATKKG
jgi:tetratricopeptide (TPR) repeat protein